MRGERGSASLLVVTMAGVLMLVAVAATVVVAMVRTHRMAQSAADLAALAGAEAAQRGGDGCAVAGEVAGANGARVLRCVSDASNTLLEVAITGPQWHGHVVELRARARAGPVEAPDR